MSPLQRKVRQLLAWQLGTLGFASLLASFRMVPAMAAVAVCGVGGTAICLLLMLRWRRQDEKRLGDLDAAVQRLRKRQFDVPFEVTDDGPVARIGHSLNDAARDLGRRFGAFEAVAQMDRAIGEARGLPPLVQVAVRCLLRVPATDAAVVVLVDVADGLSIDLALGFATGSGKVATGRFPLNPAWLDRLGQHRDTVGFDELPLPPAVVERLAQQCPGARFSLVVIGLSDWPRGYVVLARRDAAPLDAEERTIVDSVVLRLNLAASAEDAERKSSAKSIRDALTGLPNLAGFTAALDSESGAAQAGSYAIAIIVLGFDRFQQINTTLGHTVGDLLLVLAAERLRKSVERNDVVGRFRGDNFAIVMRTRATRKESAGAARTLIGALSRRYDVGGQSIYLSASAGIALSPDHGVRAEDLLKNADTALAQAKKAGRSRFAFYEDHMRAEEQRRVLLDRQLREALQRNEFVLYFQPQFDLRDGGRGRAGRIVGVEALVRWQHPDRGLTPPSAFIEFADEQGLADALGTQVIALACKQFRQWHDDGVPVPQVAVNVSLEQLQRSGFLSTVESALGAAGMPHEALVLEVNEGQFNRAGTTGSAALDALSQAGCGIAIDDFGRGFASLALLKSRHPRMVKMDPELIGDANAQNEAGSIVAAVVKMAHAQNKVVIAEGVERWEQVEFLRSVGCDMAQGFVLCPPLAAGELAHFVLKRSAGVRVTASALVPAAKPRSGPGPANDLEDGFTVPFTGVDI